MSNYKSAIDDFMFLHGNICVPLKDCYYAITSVSSIFRMLLAIFLKPNIFISFRKFSYVLLSYLLWRILILSSPPCWIYRSFNALLREQLK